MPRLRVAIALSAALVSACKSREPVSQPAPPSETKVAEPPAESAQNAGLVAPWHRPGACDPTGTWRVTLYPQQVFCEEAPKESFELSFGFVRKEGRTVLAAAGRAIDGGEIGGLLANMQVSLIAGPYAGCEVRLVRTHGVTRIEMVLGFHEDKLDGYAARWQEPTMCNESYSLGGERLTATPMQWARLGEPAAPVMPAAPRPVDAALADAVAKIPAESLLGPALAKVRRTRRYLSSGRVVFDGVVEEAVRTPLRGSIVEYVTAVVGQPQDVSLIEVPCSDPLGKRCVALAGDPCRPEFTDPEDDCEGMLLKVVVDVERGRLDRADAFGYPVRSHGDIARWEAIAP